MWVRPGTLGSLTLTKVSRTWVCTDSLFQEAEPWWESRRGERTQPGCWEDLGANQDARPGRGGHTPALPFAGVQPRGGPSSSETAASSARRAEGQVLSWVTPLALGLGKESTWLMAWTRQNLVLPLCLSHTHAVSTRSPGQEVSGPLSCDRGGGLGI